MRSVYLIRGNDGKYKIGIARHPHQRIRQLQTGNPDEIKLIDTYESENAFKIETFLHNQYSHFKSHGEWFDLSVTEEVNFRERCKTIDESLKFLKKTGNIFV